MYLHRLERVFVAKGQIQMWLLLKSALQTRRLHSFSYITSITFLVHDGNLTLSILQPTAGGSGIFYIHNLSNLYCSLR